MKRLILVCLLLMGLGACATPPTVNATSGIEGQVLIGPTCPVVRTDNPDCADKPYQATLTVLTVSGQKVTQFTTEADGKFHVSLNPGDYILHPESPNGKSMPFGREQPFTVTAGQFTQLSVSYDSGMR